MAISVQTYLNNAIATSSLNQQPFKLVSQMFDYTRAQKQAQSLADSHKQTSASLKALKTESADFLKQYTTGMNQMNSAAAKLTNSGVNNLLYGKNNRLTADTVKNTVGAVRDMVDAYNQNVGLLSDNKSRGVGVLEQLNRMSDSPASKSSLEKAAVSRNEDGTLALDEEKLTGVLQGEDERARRQAVEALGDAYGLAAGIQKDARAGLNTPAGKLVNNDVAKLQNLRDSDPIRALAAGMRGGGAYALSNSAAVGIMMNRLV